MRRLIPLLVLSITLVLSACSTSKFPWVYRIDVEQGNIVDKDKLAQVEIGMTKDQVRYLIGTPLVSDPFTPERWDYYYSFRTGKGKFDRNRLTLYFSGDTLSRMDKKEYPSEHLDY